MRLLMLLLLLVLVAESGLLSAPASVASAAPAIGDNDNDEYDNELDEDGDSLDEFVDEIEEAANEFWAAAFKAAGKPYRAPTLVKAASDQRIRSTCGNSRGADHSYCPEDEAVYLDWDSDGETSIVNLWDDDRSFVIVTTMSPQ